MKKTKTSKNTWLVTVQRYVGSEDVFIELPPDLLKKVGWKSGDRIACEENDTGVTLFKLDQKP